MIDRDHPDLPVSRQCELLDLPRSTFYHVADPVSDADLENMALIDIICNVRFMAVVASVAGWLIKGIR